MSQTANTTLLFKGCDLDATAGLGVTTAGLANLCTPVHVTDVYATESRQPSHVS